MADFQALTSLDPSQILTLGDLSGSIPSGSVLEEEAPLVRGSASYPVSTESDWELVCAASTLLHALAERRRRDRWWFLHGERVRREEYVDLSGAPVVDEVYVRTNVVGRRLLFDGRGPRLWSVILVDFGRVGARPGLAGAFLLQKEFTIEIGFGEQRKSAGIFTKRAVRGLSTAERQDLWQAYCRWQRGGERRDCSALCWIDSEAPDNSEEATRFELLLYLWQRDLIDLSPEGAPEAWAFVRTFLGWRVTEDGEALVIPTSFGRATADAMPSPNAGRGSWPMPGE